MFVGVVMSAGSARATTAELASGDAPRGERWETLALHVTVPPGGARVFVRDARGGLTVSRNVDASGGGGVVWVPLPMVAQSELPDGVWPIQVQIGDGDSTWERVMVGRPARMQSDRFRVAIAGDASMDAAALPGLSALPLATTAVSGSEVLAGPPLVFAAFDAVAVPAAVANQLDERRVLALVATGTKIVVIGDRPATLQRLSWQPLGTGKAWVFPSMSLAALPVIEPSLASSRALQVEVTAPGAVRATVALVPAAGVAVVLLLGGVLRNRWAMLLVSIMALAGLGGVIIVLLQADGPNTERRVGWSIRTTVRGDMTKRVCTEHEVLRLNVALFARPLHASVDDSRLLLPIAPDARTYFGWKGARLVLSGTDGSEELDARIPGRRGWAYLERSASLTYPEPGAGVSIEGGYVIGGDGRQLLTTFAETDGEARRAMRHSLLAWYDLRFDASHRYLLHSSSTAPAEIVVDDLGGQNDPAR
jgi:hypothetical protein